MICFSIYSQEHRGLLTIKYPMEHGVVRDWNDMERIWQYIYSKDQLQTFAEEVRSIKFPTSIFWNLFFFHKLRSIGDILIYFLRIRLSVCLLVYACSAKTVGPRSFIFGMEVGPDGGPLIFYISRSKVKGQGQISMKICLF